MREKRKWEFTSQPGWNKGMMESGNKREEEKEKKKKGCRSRRREIAAPEERIRKRRSGGDESSSGWELEWRMVGEWRTLGTRGKRRRWRGCSL